MTSENKGICTEIFDVRNFRIKNTLASMHTRRKFPKRYFLRVFNNNIIIIIRVFNNKLLLLDTLRLFSFSSFTSVLNKKNA